MKTNILALLFIAFQFPAMAQIQWQKTYGGSDNERAYCIVQTKDNGYMVAGYTESNDGDVSGNHGSTDYWIAKLSPMGAIQWQKCYGGSSRDEAHSIQQTFDSGYIVAGVSTSNDGDVSGNHGYGDYSVFKLSSTGAIQWQKCIGGSGDDQAFAVQQTSDSGYIVAGSSASYDGDVSGNHGAHDYWVVKLSKTGVLQWQKCYGGGGDDFAYSLAQTADGGYVVSGCTPSNSGDVSGNHGGVEDAWIIKLSDTGTLQWQKCLGGNGTEVGYSIVQATDGGYAVAASSNSNNDDVSGNHGSNDYWIVKLSASGGIDWQKCFGGTSDDEPLSMQQTSDNGYIVAGITKSYNGDVTENKTSGDYWVTKISSSGGLEWQKCLGGNAPDEAYSIRQTFDGNYIVAGNTYASDGDITLNHGHSDCWVVKLGLPSGVDDVHASVPISIFPNPATDIVTVKGITNCTLTLSTLTGQLISTAKNTDHISVAGIPPGIYFVQVLNNDGQVVYRDKVVKQ
jgi:hypothetical protein